MESPPTEEETLRARIAVLERELAGRLLFIRRVGAVVGLAWLLGAGGGLFVGVQWSESRVREAREAADYAYTERCPDAYGEDEPWAEEVTCPERGSLLLDAVIASTSGDPRIATGDACRVEIDWTSDPETDCRAQVRCGATRLYGDVGQGWFPCEPRSEAFTTGRDEGPTGDDGDPRFFIDRVENRIELGDDAPAWTASLRIIVPSDEIIDTYAE